MRHEQRGKIHGVSKFKVLWDVGLQSSLHEVSNDCKRGFDPEPGFPGHHRHPESKTAPPGGPVMALPMAAQ